MPVDGATRPLRAGAHEAAQPRVRESTGDLLFFLDDDVVLDPAFVATMVDTFERHPEYQGGMGTLAPITRRWSPGTIAGRLFLLQREYGDGRFSASGMPRHPYGTRRFRDVEVLGGGLMAIRRSVLTEAGLEFDERLTGYASQEDTDFSRRLSRRHRLFFDPRAVVDHRHSPRGRATTFERSAMYMRNYRYLYFKNVYPFAPWTLPAHWWAVAGLFMVAIGGRSWETVRGYRAGLAQFSRARGEPR
ncbi:MAG: glycosyltransferase family 2 protein [Candidatus Rokubacteria bacterium]|nr:glycosyltransferase family 2 protein [Candidatus Rokubacteria bacterium]